MQDVHAELQFKWYNNQIDAVIKFDVIWNTTVYTWQKGI